jgi:hypothetical protein
MAAMAAWGVHLASCGTCVITARGGSVGFRGRVYSAMRCSACRKSNCTEGMSQPGRPRGNGRAIKEENEGLDVKKKKGGGGGCASASKSKPVEIIASSWLGWVTARRRGGRA